MLSWLHKWQYRNRLAQEDAAVLIARYGESKLYREPPCGHDEKWLGVPFRSSPPPLEARVFDYARPFAI